MVGHGYGMSPTRPAEPNDHRAIRELLLAAFGTSEEANLVERLRAHGDAAIEFVVETDGAIAGHILLSPMQAPFRALALAPIAVVPVRQNAGIGGALIRAGLEQARIAGWQAVFVVGEPDYYTRFGFDIALAAPFTSPYAGPYFMALPLNDPLPAASGEVGHAPAFSALSSA